MKTYNSMSEILEDVRDGWLTVDDDVTFNCHVVGNFNINAWDIKAENINAGNIKAGNIDARNIKAENINAGNIKAENIKAGDINAGNIDAWDIDAGNIDAWDIKATDINAWDIKAENINAGDISYYAVCFAHKDIRCISIKGRRKNARHFALDGKVIIEGKEASNG